MSIQIIDGFQVNTASPIDNRIVASGSTARNAIPYKYEGLRIFDTSDSIPYVWLNGTWVSENASGVVGSGTTTNYIPKFNGSNIIGNSIIYATGSSIGVNTTSPTSITGETTVFHVNGGVRANKFVGNGSLITDINTTNITTGNLSLSRFTNGPTNWVLTGSNIGSPTYSNPTQMTVGSASFATTATTAGSATTATTATNVTVTNTTTNSTHYLAFVSAVGSTGIKANNAGITYNPSTNTLTASILTAGVINSNVTLNSATLNTTSLNVSGRTLTSLGSTSAPAISFTGDTNTGIYAPSGGNKLAFVTGNIERFRITAGAASDFEFKSPNNLKKVGLSVYDGGYTTWTMSSSTTSTFDIIGYSGLVVVGSLSKSSGSFRIDHPLESKKSTHDLVHSFVEGPRADNIYRGKVILNNGSATINLDTESNMTEGTFILLNREVQCFTTNETGWTAVKGRVTGNVLQINSEVSCSDEISWMVIGERQDKHMYDTDWTDSNGKVIVEPLKKK